jgi:HK97 gp10 family phage protein
MAAGKQVLELHGVRELVKSLSMLAPKLEQKIIRTAMRDASKVILKQAKANAPIGENREVAHATQLAWLKTNSEQAAPGSEKAMKKAAKAATKAANAAARSLKKAKQGYPGQLRDSLKIRAMKRKKGRIGFMVQTRDGDFKGDEYYASFVEYGTSKMPARGFIRAAYDSKVSEAEGIVKSQLKAGIENVVKELNIVDRTIFRLKAKF